MKPVHIMPILRKYSIFDKMIEGVQIIDKDWKYIYVNDVVAIHGKYNKDELLGYTMMEKYPGIEHTDMFKHIQKCMQEDTPHQMINEFDFPDGSKGYFELRMQPVDEGVLVLSFDVTKQKRAEQMLLDANSILDEKVRLRTVELTAKNNELEQFAYIASHDLQEPLRTVSNYLQIIEEDYTDKLDADVVGYLGAISRATNRMSLLIRVLLDFSRLGRDKQLVRVDCAQLIADLLSDMKSTIEANEAIITTSDMPVLNGYETELRQLFQNLISNAIKFQNKGVKPCIHIEAKPLAGKWWFCISDNGIGIDKIHNGRIFQIFQRLHKIDSYQGSGIGLANCKKIVELHRGEITVESEVGKGSKFIFTIANL